MRCGWYTHYEPERRYTVLSEVGAGRTVLENSAQFTAQNKASLLCVGLKSAVSVPRMWLGIRVCFTAEPGMVFYILPGRQRQCVGSTVPGGVGDIITHAT